MLVVLAVKFITAVTLHWPSLSLARDHYTSLRTVTCYGWTRDRFSAALNFDVFELTAASTINLRGNDSEEVQGNDNRLRNQYIRSLGVRCGPAW